MKVIKQSIIQSWDQHNYLVITVKSDLIIMRFHCSNLMIVLRHNFSWASYLHVDLIRDIK